MGQGKRLRFLRHDPGKLGVRRAILVSVSADLPLDILGCYKSEAVDLSFTTPIFLAQIMLLCGFVAG